MPLRTDSGSCWIAVSLLCGSLLLSRQGYPLDASHVRILARRARFLCSSSKVRSPSLRASEALLLGVRFRVRMGFMVKALKPKRGGGAQLLINSSLAVLTADFSQDEMPRYNQDQLRSQRLLDKRNVSILSDLHFRWTHRLFEAY